MPKGFPHEFKNTALSGACALLRSLRTSCRVMQVMSSTFFLFFACLAPAVAFGGLLGICTAGSMGTIEASSAKTTLLFMFMFLT